jgi:hypothetical protein
MLIIKTDEQGKNPTVLVYTVFSLGSPEGIPSTSQIPNIQDDYRSLSADKEESLLPSFIDLSMTTSAPWADFHISHKF